MDYVLLNHSVRNVPSVALLKLADMLLCSGNAVSCIAYSAVMFPHHTLPAIFSSGVGNNAIDIT
jgi:hypothetical protein